MQRNNELGPNPIQLSISIVAIMQLCGKGTHAEVPVTVPSQDVAHVLLVQLYQHWKVG